MPAVIEPSQHPVIFDSSWHSQGREVTLYSVQILTSYHMLPLAAKGMRFKNGGPVKFLNLTFKRKLSAEKWLEVLRPVVNQIRSN